MAPASRRCGAAATCELTAMPVEVITLCGITFIAAIVNGALGYGFSSLTVPVALLYYTNRVLNPALVMIEVVLNGYVLFVNREALPAVWRRVLPIVVGLPAGVLLGTLLLSRINPAWMKVWTFAFLIPVILIQAAGYRRPIKWGRSFGVGFGSGLGVLYAVTTISGPPLAVLLNNEGYAKREFRASVGLIRLAESLMTATAYVLAGLLTTETLGLSMTIVPSLVLGVPIGAWIIRHVRTETFRRICMSLDAWLVAFGLASVLHALNVASGFSASGVFLTVAVIDIWLLYRFFHPPLQPRQIPLTG